MAIVETRGMVGEIQDQLRFLLMARSLLQTQAHNGEIDIKH